MNSKQRGGPGWRSAVARLQSRADRCRGRTMFGRIANTPALRTIQQPYPPHVSPSIRCTNPRFSPEERSAWLPSSSGAPLTRPGRPVPLWVHNVHCSLLPLFTTPLFPSPSATLPVRARSRTGLSGARVSRRRCPPSHLPLRPRASAIRPAPMRVSGIPGT